jgi:hypothetical protein
MRGGALVVVAFAALSVSCNEPERPADVQPSASASAAARPLPPGDVSITTTSAEARAAFDKGRELQLNTREAEAIAAF